MLPRGLVLQRSVTTPPLLDVASGLASGIRGRAAALGAAAALGFGGLALAVARLDAPMALGGVLLLSAVLVPLLLWPELATVVVVFLLYTNAPVLATNHGVPFVAASSFMLLLGLPLLQHVILRRERFRADRVLLLMLVLLVVMLVSSVGAKGPTFASDYIQTYVLEGVLLYWLVVNAIPSRESLLRAVWTLLAAGALLGALTTYQEATGDLQQQFGGLAQRNTEYLELQQMDMEDPQTLELLAEGVVGGQNSRAEGPMNEPNRFAQILLVLLPLALHVYRTSQGARARLCAASAAALIVAGMVFSASRGALVALVLLALIAGYVRWIRRSHLMLAGLALVLCIPVVAPQYAARALSLTNVTALAQGTAGRTADGAIRGRATEMLAAAQAALDHPLLGVGPGQYLHFYSLEYQQKEPRLKFRDIQKGRRAHSLYVELPAELGIVGLVSFLAIYAVLLRGLYGAHRRWRATRPELADLGLAFAFSLLAFLITSMFLHLSYQRYHFLLVALASVALHLLQSPERAERGAIA